jgi:hypothetical protein
MTRHPGARAGVHISRSEVVLGRQAIVDSLNKHRELTFTQLGDVVQRKIEGDLEDSVSCYYTMVKQDLEARGEIERTGSESPQQIRLPHSDIL